MNLALPSEYSVDEMLALLPANSDNFAADSSVGKTLLRTRRNGLLHLIARELWQSVRQGYRGSRRGEVLKIYETTYEGDHDPLAIANRDVSRERQVVFRLGTQHLVRTGSSNAHRLWAYRLGDLIGALNAPTVTEIGSGAGRNLFYLANRFPGIQFKGFELTMSGTKMARQLQAIDLPNTNIGRHYGISAHGMDNVRRIEFKQASAFDLSAEDMSSDVVFTFSALEQMGDGFAQALRGIRKVTRKYALFHEPFLDCNDFLGHTYLWARNYFRLRIADLGKYGFEPVRSWHALPAKPTFSNAFVLCRPV